MAARPEGFDSGRPEFQCRVKSIFVRVPGVSAALREIKKGDGKRWTYQAKLL